MKFIVKRAVGRNHSQLAVQHQERLPHRIHDVFRVFAGFLHFVFQRMEFFGDHLLFVNVQKVITTPAITFSVVRKGMRRIKYQCPSLLCTSVFRSARF